MTPEMKNREKDLTQRTIKIGLMLLAINHLELGKNGWRRYYSKHLLPKEWGGECQP